MDTVALLIGLLVGVILGAPNHRQLNAAVSALIASATNAFSEVQLVAEGDRFGSYTTPWGSTADIVAAEAASVLVWQDAAITVTPTASDLEFGADGSDVGSVTFETGGERIVVPLELEEDLEAADAGWKLTHPFG